MQKNLIGKKFGYLTVIEMYGTEEVLCQCDCGKRTIKTIKEFNSKKKHSCGCLASSREYSSLHKIWTQFNDEEKSIWENWDNFVFWCKKCGYCPIFSVYKITKKVPYSKENIRFGLSINKKFFTIEELKKAGYRYNERQKMFVTSYRFNGQIMSQDKITSLLNKDTKKQKTFPKKYFNELLQKVQKNK